MNFIEKFLRANYNVWKYASEGQKNFICKQCGSCCKDIGAYSLLPEEYEELRKTLPLDKFVKVKVGDYYIIQMKEPCPFLGNDNRCTIYESRFVVCKSFPLIIDSKKYPDSLRFRIHHRCKHIESDETVDISLEGFKNMFLISYKTLDLNEWRKYDMDIKDLEEHTIKKTFVPKSHLRTWCSVCSRSFNDRLNHSHKLPPKIEIDLKYIGFIKESFKNNEDYFMYLIYKHIKGQGV